MAAYVFSGLILAYIILGLLYSSITHVQFEDKMPIIFILRDLLLAILIAAFWQIFLAENIIKNMRYYLRIILFVGTLSILLLGFFAIFYVAPVDWSKLWLMIAGIFVVLIAVISIACELCFRRTGKRYTEILDEYKKKTGI